MWNAVTWRRRCRDGRNADAISVAAMVSVLRRTLKLNGSSTSDLRTS
ncbi:hypothetical protein ABH922_000825 [Rhodococcus sp. 27YEA15]